MLAGLTPRETVPLLKSKLDPVSRMGLAYSSFRTSLQGSECLKKPTAKFTLRSEKLHLQSQSNCTQLVTPEVKPPSDPVPWAGLMFFKQVIHHPWKSLKESLLLFLSENLF